MIVNNKECFKSFFSLIFVFLHFTEQNQINYSILLAIKATLLIIKTILYYKKTKVGTVNKGAKGHLQHVYLLLTKLPNFLHKEKKTHPQNNIEHNLRKNISKSINYYFKKIKTNSLSYEKII